MTVQQLLDNTDSAELGEWVALYMLEHHERTSQSSDVEGDLKKLFGKPQ